MLKEIKKVEYRKDPDNNDVVDFIGFDNTKRKVPVADLDAEITTINSQIAALQRRLLLVDTTKTMVAQQSDAAAINAALNSALNN